MFQARHLHLRFEYVLQLQISQRRLVVIKSLINYIDNGLEDKFQQLQDKGHALSILEESQLDPHIYHNEDDEVIQ